MKPLEWQEIKRDGWSVWQRAEHSCGTAFVGSRDGKWQAAVAISPDVGMGWIGDDDEFLETEKDAKSKCVKYIDWLVRWRKGEP